MSVHELVSGDLRDAIAPPHPPHPPRPKGGRPLAGDRAARCGILSVLRAGIQWRMPPTERGGGSGVTCWRRLRDWARAGVWRRLHRVLLDRPGEADKLDRSRASPDSASLLAKKGATRSARVRRIAAGRARSATAS